MTAVDDWITDRLGVAASPEQLGGRLHVPADLTAQRLVVDLPASPGYQLSYIVQERAGKSRLSLTHEQVAQLGRDFELGRVEPTLGFEPRTLLFTN